MSQEIKRSIDVSLVITLSERVFEMEELYLAFNAQMQVLNKQAEFIFVQNISFQEGWDKLREMVRRYDNCRAIRVRDVFTESDCLTMGFENVRGKYIVTVPIYYQVDPIDIGALLKPLEDGDVDLTVAARIQRKDSWLNQIESRIYNSIIRKMTNISTHDLGSGVIAMKAEVAKSMDIYGELFRFIPILADRKGYNIKEVLMHHLSRRKKTGIYAFGAYMRRFLDILTIFFLMKFTKKPLRFFGLIGASCFFMALVTGVSLTIDKIGGHAIGNRPLLVLCALLAVLGIQLFSIGLIGEIIIFTHAKEMKEYYIEEIIE